MKPEGGQTWANRSHFFAAATEPMPSGPFVNKVLPDAHVVHAYPNERFYAKHPK